MLKKTRRVTIALAAVVLLVSLFGITASATALNTTINENYKTVYPAATAQARGINRWLNVHCYNASGEHHNDVRMLDKNGNVVWEEYGAVGSSSSRDFWCGSNVYYLQVRVAPKGWLGLFDSRTGSCNVT